jgi:hypothetical protein
MSAAIARASICEPLNLKLLPDFFNKIDPSPPFTIFAVLAR